MLQLLWIDLLNSIVRAKLTCRYHYIEHELLNWTYQSMFITLYLCNLRGHLFIKLAEFTYLLIQFYNRTLEITYFLLVKSVDDFLFVSTMCLLFKKTERAHSKLAIETKDDLLKRWVTFTPLFSFHQWFLSHLLHLAISDDDASSSCSTIGTLGPSCILLHSFPALWTVQSRALTTHLDLTLNLVPANAAFTKLLHLLHLLLTINLLRHIAIFHLKELKRICVKE